MSRPGYPKPAPPAKPPPLPPRDVAKTLPGTGVTPIVDGDLVAGVIRDLAIGVQRLENGMHQRFDALEPTPTEPIPPPSKGKKAAAATVNFAKWGTLAVGALGIAAQIAKVWRPSLVAPLDQALDLAHQLLPGTP